MEHQGEGVVLSPTFWYFRTVKPESLSSLGWQDFLGGQFTSAVPKAGRAAGCVCVRKPPKVSQGRQAVTHTHLQNSAVISDLRDVAGPFWICANLHQASSDLEEHQA